MMKIASSGHIYIHMVVSGIRINHVYKENQGALGMSREFLVGTLALFLLSPSWLETEAEPDPEVSIIVKVM